MVRVDENEEKKLEALSGGTVNLVILINLPEGKKRTSLLCKKRFEKPMQDKKKILMTLACFNG